MNKSALYDNFFLMTPRTFFVCSIDPGIRNFAYVICRVDVDMMMVTAGANPLTLAFDAMEVVSVTKADLCPGGVRDHAGMVRACRSLNRVLDNDRFFPRVSFVVIEAQRGSNMACMKMAQHAMSFATLRIPTACIYSMAPRVKLDIFGGPIGMSARQRKRFSVESVLRCMESRPPEAFSLLRECLSRVTKMDDVADAVLQLAAFLRLLCTKPNLYRAQAITLSPS